MNYFKYTSRFIYRKFLLGLISFESLTDFDLRICLFELDLRICLFEHCFKIRVVVAAVMDEMQ